MREMRDAFRPGWQHLVSDDVGIAEFRKEALHMLKQRRIAFLIIRPEVYPHVRHIGNLCQKFDIRFGEDIKILNADKGDTRERGFHQFRREVRGKEKMHLLFIYPTRAEFTLIVIVEFGERS